MALRGLRADWRVLANRAGARPRRPRCQCATPSSRAKASGAELLRQVERGRHRSFSVSPASLKSTPPGNPLPPGSTPWRDTNAEVAENRHGPRRRSVRRAARPTAARAPACRAAHSGRDRRGPAGAQVRRDLAQRLELQPVELDAQQRRHLGRGFAPRHRRTSKDRSSWPPAKAKRTSRPKTLPLPPRQPKRPATWSSLSSGSRSSSDHRVLELDVADDLRHAGGESEREPHAAASPRPDLHRQRQPFAPRGHVGVLRRAYNPPGGTVPVAHAAAAPLAATLIGAASCLAACRGVLNRCSPKRCSSRSCTRSSNSCGALRRSLSN